MIENPPLFAADAPPDAGASYLGAYSLANEWVTWLIGRAPELVAEPPSRLSQAESPPRCTYQVSPWERCGTPMYPHRRRQTGAPRPALCHGAGRGGQMTDVLTIEVMVPWTTYAHSAASRRWMRAFDAGKPVQPARFRLRRVR